jgi:hypothetical protein
MAKDRARDIRRSTGSLAKMGAALGWDRTSYQGVTFAHKTENKDKASQGYHSEGSFVPGAGHVDDEVPHRGWLGIGGSRKGMAE